MCTTKDILVYGIICITLSHNIVYNQKHIGTFLHKTKAKVLILYGLYTFCTAD